MKLRILIAEDDDIQALALEDELREAGHEVVAITNTLSDTILFLAANPVDVVVLDLELRGQMTFPVLDVAQRRGIPQIVTTGHDPSALKELPGVRVIEKPFSASDLLEIIATLTRLSGERA